LFEALLRLGEWIVVCCVSIVVLIDTTDNIVLVPVVGPGVLRSTLPHLQLVAELGIRLPWHVRGVEQVEDLALGLLDGVSDAHDRGDRSWHAAKNVQEGSVSVNFRHSLIEHSR